ncbi:hypothetical protein FB446DRAFT_724692 [Lentinula raphanica]|nr:hypothetical protein FB446DRAFT_724692 [Lentinula raphanica]
MITPKSVLLESEEDFVELPPHELWMTFIKNVHDIPDALDLDKFQTALSRTLEIYPHACGRLVKETNERGMSCWKIRLTKSTIPLEIVESEGLPKFTDSVIQDDLAPLLPRTDFDVVNADNALISLKLHVSAQRTIIGVAWHHTLGDAATLLRFLTTFSEYYEGHEPDIGSLPVFKKHHFSDPSPAEIQKWLPHMSHLACTYSAAEIQVKYNEGNEPTVPIRAIIKRSDAEAIRRRAQAEQNSNRGLTISLQDALSATVVAAINRSYPNSVRRVTNAAGYRQVNAEWNLPNVAGNSIYIVSTRDFDAVFSQDIGYVAAMIRKSLLEARKAEYVAGYMSVASHQMALAAENNEQFFFGSDRSTLSVNSNLIFDWQSIGFGCSNTRFYTPGITRFYLRIFLANPSSTLSKGEALDLTFGAPASMRSGIIEQLGSDFMIVQ